MSLEQLLESVRTGEWNGRQRETGSCFAAPAAMFFGGRRALRQEVGNGAAFPSDKLRVALANAIANLRILKFQLIPKLVGSHDVHDGDAVLLKDEILAIEPDALDDSAKIDTGFGYGYAVDRGSS